MELADALNNDERVRLCGLGPRDSLRLEAGLCLYGEPHLFSDVYPLCWQRPKLCSLPACCCGRVGMCNSSASTRLQPHAGNGLNEVHTHTSF